jgi:hypothetical protein
MGDNTHHHNQSMIPKSFKAMKTIVRRTVNPITNDEDERDVLM